MQPLEPFKNILFYHPFSSTQYPSGHYWIKGYSAFNKIGISFHSANEFKKIMIYGDPKRYKSPPFKIEWSKDNQNEKVENLKSNKKYECSKIESEIGKLVYHLTVSLKSKYRNQKSKYSANNIRLELIELWGKNRNSN